MIQKRTNYILNGIGLYLLFVSGISILYAFYILTITFASGTMAHFLRVVYANYVTHSVEFSFALIAFPLLFAAGVSIVWFKVVPRALLTVVFSINLLLEFINAFLGYPKPIGTDLALSIADMALSIIVIFVINWSAPNNARGPEFR